MKKRCHLEQKHSLEKPGTVAKLVACPITDPGVMSSIPAWPNSFVEIDHEILSSHSPPSAASRYTRKYVH